MAKCTICLTLFLVEYISGYEYHCAAITHPLLDAVRDKSLLESYSYSYSYSYASYSYSFILILADYRSQANTVHAPPQSSPSHSIQDAPTDLYRISIPIQRLGYAVSLLANLRKAHSFRTIPLTTSANNGALCVLSIG